MADAEKDIKKDLNRLRSEVRKALAKEPVAMMTNTKIPYSSLISNSGYGSVDLAKATNPFTGLVSGNYWTQSGMPWATAEGRKAVMTEWFWQPIRGQPRRVDTNELRNFSQTFWINSCITTIQDEISALDWDIIEKEDEEYGAVEDLIKDVKDFLKYPNKNGESFAEVLRAVIKDIYELDAGVIVKVYTLDSYDFENLEPKSGSPLLKPRGMRKLVELYARDGSSFLKETDKFGSVKGYWQYSYQIPAHPMWFNKDEISYIMRNSRSMSVYGYAPTQAVLDIVKSLHYSLQFNKRYFEENALPDGVISLLDSNQNDVNAFVNQWNNEFKGMPHKLAVTTQEAKWTPLGYNYQELQFMESQNWYYKLVISQFGLTPSELGMTEDLNRSTSASQSELTKRKGIRPLLKILENYLNREIIPELCAAYGYTDDKDIPVEFAFIYDDPTEKAQRLNNSKLELDMGLRTPNEIRSEELGLPPIPGGDEIRGQASQVSINNQFGSNEKNNGDPEEQAKQSSKKERDDNEEKTDKKPIKKAATLSTDIDPNQIQFIANQEGVDRNELIAGIAEESEEHMASLNNMNTILILVLDHLKSDPNYYSHQAASKPKMEQGEVFDGMGKSVQPQASVGAYYSEPQEVIQQNRGKPQATQEVKIKIPRSENPEQPQMDGNKCPACGYSTMHQTTNQDDVSQEQKWECQNCRSSFSMEEIKANQSLANAQNTMMSNNQTDPESKLDWSPKGLKKNLKKEVNEMQVSEWTNFQKDAFSDFVETYALSTQYKKLLQGFLSDLKETDVEKIITKLSDLIGQDKSIQSIARAINLIIHDKERALTIARTESSRIVSEAHYMKLKEKGVKKVKWIQSGDNRTCKKCSALDGKVFALGKAPNPADVHVNCRCTTVEVYE